MPAPKTKSENKSKDEKVKPAKDLSPKRQMEEDHKSGEHKSRSVFVDDCEYCVRGALRAVKRTAAARRFLTANKK